MNPQDMEVLKKFTVVAKKIVYEPERFKQFLGMLGSMEGALHAVSTVLSVIEKHKPIPPQIMTQLAMNTYLVMVELARDVTGHKPDQKIMEQVMKQIHDNISQIAPHAQEPAAEEAAEPVQEPQAQEQMEPQQGLIAKKMGVV